MKMTIIPVDKTVYVDGYAISSLVWSGTPDDVHALQWFEVEGWIEYKDTAIPNQTITQLPDWANNAYAAWEQARYAPKPPATAEQNKQTAVAYLKDTDWATIPDVADPTKSNPYLVNVNDFLTYRNQVRQIAVNPVAGDLTWPDMPVAVWGTV